MLVCCLSELGLSDTSFVPNEWFRSVVFVYLVGPLTDENIANHLNHHSQ